MCLFHKWSKWQEYHTQMKYWDRCGKEHFGFERFQKRICLKCNKVKVERIYE